jgi:hypothetical protein
MLCFLYGTALGVLFKHRFAVAQISGLKELNAVLQSHSMLKTVTKFATN